MSPDVHKIVKYWAHQYATQNRNSILDESDYVQEAYLALLEAHPHYDKNKGPYFQWATTVVINHLSHYASKNNSILNTTKLSTKLAAKIYSLEKSGFTTQQIQNKLGINHARYLEVRNLLYKRSLNDLNLAVTNYDDIMLELELSLTNEEFTLLKKLFKYDIKEIAEKSNRSYEFVRQKVKDLFNKIHKILELTS